MALENKLGITNPIELAKMEEKLSKQQAKQLFETGEISKLEVRTFAGLQQIHHKLFSDIYDFAGRLRTINIAKGNFRFAPVMYLAQALQHIDQMPQNTILRHVRASPRLLKCLKGSHSAPYWRHS